MISMILGLLLIVIVVRVIVSILVNPGLLLRIAFGFALLVVLGIASLAMLIGTFSARAAARVSMPGVTVNPTGVQVYSGTGESVKVTPFGVEVNSRTRSSRQGTWTENGVSYREVNPVPADPSIIRRHLPVSPDSVSPAREADADTPVYSYRNKAEEEERTSAEFHRVFERYMGSPSPAAVAAEGAPQVAPALSAETPEQSTGANGTPPWMFDRQLADAAWQAAAKPPPVQAEAPEKPAAPPAAGEPQRLLSDHFDPDVYQSEGAAVRGLTNQVAKLLDTVTSGAQEPNPIVIKGKISQSLMQEMQGILAKEFPSAWVHWSKGSTQVDDRTVIVYACREPEEGNESTATRGSAAGSPQFLRMDVTGAKGKVSRSAKFLDKPWVDDFATFASSNRERSWVVAMSPGAAVSAAEAEQQALNAAVEQLEPRVRDRLDYYARDAADSLLQRQIRAGLESSGMIVDRFVQRFERPYGEIWQVGLLVDASPRKIGALAEKCDRVLAVEQRTFRRTAWSIAGLVALVCVVYILLNSVTKGYFVWSLRAGALAILAGGIFLVLLLSHNRPAIEGFLR